MSITWNQLAQLPKTEYTCTYKTPFVIDKNQFVVIGSNVLHLYNLKTDKYTKYATYSQWRYCPTTASNDKKILYIYQIKSHDIIKINLEKDTIDIIDKHVDSIDSTYYDNASIVVNNKLHIFGSRQRSAYSAKIKEHMILDESIKNKKSYKMEMSAHGSRSLRVVDSMDGIDADSFRTGILGDMTTYYTASEQSITIVPVVVGSYEDGPFKIYKYWMATKEYSSINISLSKWKTNMQIGSVVTTDKRFVIFFGGSSMSPAGYDDIYSDIIQVLSWKDMKVRDSKIHCPKKGDFKAMIYRDENNEEILTFGYIRELIRISGLQFPPIYLIKTIALWLCMEIVHLYSYRSHWTICVDDILA